MLFTIKGLTNRADCDKIPTKVFYPYVWRAKCRTKQDVFYRNINSMFA